ncbi:MAG TPA: hypothetical protein VFY04_07660 [Solirubrobacterales bacterium]|nr:hypothetical protein [Solirubrobacterales bacterium]
MARCLLASVAAVLLLGAAPAAAAPVLEVSASPNPATAPAGGYAEFDLTVSNSGDVATSGLVTVDVTVPPGLEVGAASANTVGINTWKCTVAADAASLRCEGPGNSLFGPFIAAPIAAGQSACQSGTASCRITVAVKVASSTPPGTVVSPDVEACGGGAPACFEGTAPIEIGPPSEFGIGDFDVQYLDRDGTAATQAGSHPYAMVTKFEVETVRWLNAESGLMGNAVSGKIKDVVIEQLDGFVGNGTMPRCSSADFLSVSPVKPVDTNKTACPDATVVGISDVDLFFQGGNPFPVSPIYNLEPPPGKAARLGFRIRGVPAVVDVVPKEVPNYNIVAASLNTSAAVPVISAKVMLWGVPADAAHDFHRGNCAEVNRADFKLIEGEGGCSYDAEPKAFLTLPRSCGGSTESSYSVSAWEEPQTFVRGSVVNHDGVFGYDPETEPPNPQDFTGCARVGFGPTIEGASTTRAAQSPTGLNFGIEVDDPNLTSAKEGAIADTEIKKAVVTLPEGVTANPSLAEGLEVCTEAQLEAETVASPQGAHCPDGAKIGTVEVESPLIDQTVDGAVYVAEPFKNKLGSLIALYIVIKNPELGIIVKNRLKVEPDPQTGQLTTTVADIPQLPFSQFRMKLREGGRSPLISPPGCGKHTITAELTPWSGGSTITETSSFEIISGPNEGPCPSGGRPFEPGFFAGALNNNGGSFSPFMMRLTRRDGDQDLVRFDATLPPGVLAKLAGVDKCSDAQIAAAKAKTGKEELASPSCPANSKIGNVWGGAGVGSQLTYVPGSVYLAGPFDGAPISVVGVVPAVAGPFDVGTVVTQQALVVDPVTGIVRADGEKSDPIPHILAGIPLNVRDIQVRIDRPEFTLNPTSCDPYATLAGIWGGGNQVFSLLDDSPVDRSAHFQASNCSRLGFKPHLALRLRGGTRRGANPALRAVLRPRPGDANLEDVVVRLPRSAFLDQAHIRTICTRVEFAADNCPKGSIYGRVRAFTPLLDEPLEGPAYLRSSDNELPDLVYDLNGLVDIESSARIDSIGGGIRATFKGIPDAPLTKVVVNMQGGKKGLIVNSRNLCSSRSRANVRLDGHNGKERSFRPVVRAGCGKGRKGHKR